MIKSVATAVVAFSFILGVVLVSATKIETDGKLSSAKLKPSVNMLKFN